MAINARVSNDGLKLIIEVDIGSNAFAAASLSKYNRRIVATTSQGKRHFVKAAYGNNRGQYVTYSLAVVEADAPRDMIERDGNSAPFAPDYD